MTEPVTKLLGAGIVWCERPSEAGDVLIGRTRFLDKLWLPCDLAQLTAEQILVINRYREQVIAVEGQYNFARNARRAMSRVAERLYAKKLVEIGCGKFPIEVSANEYIGVDIDEEALQFIKNQGLVGCNPECILTVAQKNVDVIISAYAMHFSVSDSFIDDLASITIPDAVFCFNLIVEEAVNPIALLARLAPHWPFCQVIKTESMARREYFFLVGRQHSHSKLDQAAIAVRMSKASST